MKHTATRLLAATAGVCLAAVGIAAPSSATSANAQSSYAAGYQGNWSDQSTDVVVKGITVPTIDCKGSSFQGLLLGAGSEPTVGQPEYLGGLWIACAGGQPFYALQALAGDVDDMDTVISPGDNIQIVILIQCQAFPTCDVMSDVTDTDNETNVHAESTVKLTGTSVIFGALPLFGSSGLPAPVPAFGTVRLKGCLFQGQLLSPADATKVNRKHSGVLQIKTGKIKVGSFNLTYVSP